MSAREETFAPDDQRVHVSGWRQAATVARYELLLMRRERLVFLLLFIIPAVLILVVGRSLETANAGRFTAGVPGFAVMFVFSIISSAGNAFFRDVWWQTWPRTLSLPCRTAALIVGKLAPVFLVGIVQLTFLVVGAHVVLGVPLAGSWWALAALFVATVAVACSVGLLLVALVPTTGALSQATYLFVILGGMVGGGLAPVDTLPGWVASVGRLTPQYWAIRGIGSEMAGPGGIMAVGPSLGALAVIFVIVASVAAWRFDLDAVASR